LNRHFFWGKLSLLLTIPFQADDKFGQKLNLKVSLHKLLDCRNPYYTRLFDYLQKKPSPFDWSRVDKVKGGSFGLAKWSWRFEPGGICVLLEIKNGKLSSLFFFKSMFLVLLIVT